MAQNYCPVSLFSVVSKVFARLVNKRIVDHLQKCSLFSNFQDGFSSSGSTADPPLAVASFNSPGATRGVALDISKGLACWSSSQI